jgi:hypothetical protein
LGTLNECKSFQLFNKFLEEGKTVGEMSLEEVLEFIRERPKALLTIFEVSLCLTFADFPALPKNTRRKRYDHEGIEEATPSD